MKTNKRILGLAEYTLAGHRGEAFQEFRAVVAANGYEMARGGWVKRNGEHVTRGWESFAYMVSQSREITLSEPTEAEEEARETEAREYLEHVNAEQATKASRPALETAFLHPGADSFPYPTRGLIPEVDAILDRRAEEAAEDAHVVYFYTTRTPTIPLSALTEVTTVIQDEATAESEGPCASGAALDCEGRGFLRVLPESMLGDAKPEQVIQCVPCYEASAAAYARKVHHYGETEA